MFIDPIIVMWGLLAGASVAAFMIGKYWSIRDRDMAIEDTIIYLVENNFVRSRKIDGEIELIPLDEN